MNRFTAIVSLVAYLIGGWLAPALHHHHHDGVLCHHAEHVSQQTQPDDCFDSKPSRSRECCEHDRSRGHQRPADNEQSISTQGSYPETQTQSSRSRAQPNPFGSVTSSTKTHSALCALCIARTSAKERYSPQIATVVAELSGQQSCIDQPVHANPISTGWLSRGPPCFG